MADLSNINVVYERYESVYRVDNEFETPKKNHIGDTIYRETIGFVSTDDCRKIEEESTSESEYIENMYAKAKANSEKVDRELGDK